MFSVLHETTTVAANGTETVFSDTRTVSGILVIASQFSRISLTDLSGNVYLPATFATAAAFYNIETSFIADNGLKIVEDFGVAGATVYVLTSQSGT